MSIEINKIKNVQSNTLLYYVTENIIMIYRYFWSYKRINVTYDIWYKFRGGGGVVEP